MARKRSNSNLAEKTDVESQNAEGLLVSAESTLASGLSTASERLLLLLNNMSELTRKRSVLEMDIARISNLNEKYGSEADALASRLEELSVQNKELKSRFDDLSQNQKSLSKENQSLEKTVAKLETEVAKLESDLSESKKSSSELEKKKTRLAEDVDRLAAIKAEYLERIAKFKAMREELTK